MLSPARAPTAMYQGTVSGSSAIAVTAVAQIAMVTAMTGRMPQTPMRRLVSGPAMAWPMLVAASTRPAEP